MVINVINVKKYRNFAQYTVLYICSKTFVSFTSSGKYISNNGKVFKEEESITTMQILDLIDNINE